MLEEELQRINELALWDYTSRRTGDDALLILGSRENLKPGERVAPWVKRREA